MDYINNSPSRESRPPSFDEDTDAGLKGSILQFIWETVKVVVISLLIIIPVRYFLVQPFFVNGESMMPNLHDREYLIIDEIRYKIDSPQRGDIVVFRYPRDPGQFFIKRVIGLPGETVSIRQGNVMVINEEYEDGVLLPEGGYLPEAIETRGDVSVHLADDEYYLLGDNRTASLDSRNFGPVKDDLIIGRAFLRGWPIDRWTVFGRQEYNI